MAAPQSAVQDALKTLKARRLASASSERPAAGGDGDPFGGGGGIESTADQTGAGAEGPLRSGASAGPSAPPRVSKVALAWHCTGCQKVRYV